MAPRLPLLSLTLAAAAVMGLALAPAKDGEVLTRADKQVPVEHLVQDLASPDFRVRETATVKLRELGKPAIPALKKGTTSSDLETRRRCAQLLDQIVNGGASLEEPSRVIARVTAKWAKRDVRAFLDRLAKEEKFATPEHLREALDLGQYVAARAGQIRGKPFSSLRLDLANLSLAKPKERLQDKTVLIPGLVPARDCAMKGCLAVTGPNPRLRIIWDSVVFVVGDLGDCTEFGNSIVVCLGGMGKVCVIRASIVLATGRCDRIDNTFNSFFEIQALGNCDRATNNIFLNLKEKHGIHRRAPIGAPPPGPEGDRFLFGPGPLELFHPPNQGLPGPAKAR